MTMNIELVHFRFIKNGHKDKLHILPQSLFILEVASVEKQLVWQVGLWLAYLVTRSPHFLPRCCPGDSVCPVPLFLQGCVCTHCVRVLSVTLSQSHRVR